MGLLIVFFLLSIVFSFLCSIWEAVLLSITPSFVRRTQNENPSLGNLLLSFKSDIDKPLSAILTLNTIAHTAGAIGVGAQAGQIFGNNQFNLLGIGLSYESIIAALMTLAILILSEIIPKTIGANNWRTLAGFTAQSVKVLMILLSPFVWLSKLITKSLGKPEGKSVLSRGDFEAMADAIQESGQMDVTDHTVIKNVLAFDELKAEDIMTPKTVMVMADENGLCKDLYQRKDFWSFSRIPLYQRIRDTVTGMVLKADVLKELAEGRGDTPLTEIKREIQVIEDDLSLREAFSRLKEKKEHIAVVVDEHGVVRGLITLEDIFETIFGIEIMDESDSIEDLRLLARQRWEERAKSLGLLD
jgi:CBS domain containing-hemolysin-like protein